MVSRSKNSTKLPVAMVALAAEPLFNIGGFTVTNSLLNAWIATVFFILIAVVASRRKSIVPKGIHNFFEAVVEFLLGEVEKVTNDKEKAVAFFPFVATIFLFILVNNWLGLLPGTGTIGIYGLMHGEVELIPLLRPAAADLNFTLAIAVLSIVVVQLAGIRATGFVNYVSKFVNVRGIFRAFKKGPIAVVVAIIEFFVGLIEIISEVARIISLSLRLFGNVFAGEILIGVILGLAGYFVPIPFIFLEILVGAIQATVFAMLVLVFLTVATDSHGGEDGHDSHDEVKEKAHA